jgi:thioredoxin 1
MTKETNDSNLQEVIDLKGLTIIDFWAQWCGPCRILGPIIDTLATENTDINIYKIDVDGSPESCAKYGIRSIPTVLFLKDGEVVDKFTGAKSKEFIQEKIDTFK